MKKIILIALSLLLSEWLFAQKVIKAEYFFDTDPGYGSGVAVVFANPQATVANYSFTIPVTNLFNGFHNIDYDG